jgi:hypothetical protein
MEKDLLSILTIFSILFLVILSFKRKIGVNNRHDVEIVLSLISVSTIIYISLILIIE